MFWYYEAKVKYFTFSGHGKMGYIQGKNHVFWFKYHWSIMIKVHLRTNKQGRMWWHAAAHMLLTIYICVNLRWWVNRYSYFLFECRNWYQPQKKHQKIKLASILQKHRWYSFVSKYILFIIEKPVYFDYTLYTFIFVVSTNSLHSICSGGIWGDRTVPTATATGRQHDTIMGANTTPSTN